MSRPVGSDLDKSSLRHGKGPASLTNQRSRWPRCPCAASERSNRRHAATTRPAPPPVRSSREDCGFSFVGDAVALHRLLRPPSQLMLGCNVRRVGQLTADSRSAPVLPQIFPIQMAPKKRSPGQLANLAKGSAARRKQSKVTLETVEAEADDDAPMPDAAGAPKRRMCRPCLTALACSRVLSLHFSPRSNCWRILLRLLLRRWSIRAKSSEKNKEPSAYDVAESSIPQHDIHKIRMCVGRLLRHIRDSDDGMMHDEREHYPCSWCWKHVLNPNGKKAQ